MQHLNLHQSAAYEPRITQPNLLKSFAEKALANVPGSQTVIDKHFDTSYIC